MNIQEIRAKYPQYSDIGDRELLTALHGKFYSDMPLEQFFRKVQYDQRGSARNQVLNDPITKGALNPVGGDLENFAAGAGKALVELGGGAAQAVRDSNPLTAGPFAPFAALMKMGASKIAPTSQEVQERRDRDAPLMATPEGFSGNIVGGALASTPAILAGPSIPAAALSGAVFGAAQPTVEGESRLLNTAIGGVLGGAIQGGMSLLNRPRPQPAPTVREETFRAGQALGLKTPPSTVTDSWLANRLESIGGKAATMQQAAKGNQPVIDEVARRAAGLAPDEQITPQTLQVARDRIAGPYQELRAVSPRAGQLLDDWRQAKFDANLYYKSFNPADKKEAIRLQAQASQLERQMEQEAISAGRPDLISQLRQARVDLAKNFDIQDAVNKGSGEVDLSVIGRMYDAGKPMTGELETLAKFQQAFPMSVREGGRVPTPGVSALEPFAGAALGMGGHAVGGTAGAIAAGGIPLIRGPVRSMLLSDSVQDALANPSVSQGILANTILRAMLPPALIQAYLSQQ